MRRYPTTYKTPDKDVVKSVRIPLSLVERSIVAANNLGISWSDFVRQGINRNIALSEEAELQLRALIQRTARGG